MADIKLQEINMYVNGTWRRLHAVNGQDNNGQIYADGAWRGFLPGDRVYHDGNWHQIEDTNLPTNPVKQVNTIRIRREDWYVDEKRKFGLSVELAYPAATALRGYIVYYRGSMRFSFPYSFGPGMLSTNMLNTENAYPNDIVKFVSGTVIPSEDSKYKYEFAHKENDYIR